MRSVLRLGMAIAIGGALALAASPAAGQALGVTISGFAFVPRSLTVQVGDAVSWRNADSAAHTATADGGAWDTKAIAGNGTSLPVLMSAAGTFPYHCAIHPGMTGTVVVVAVGPVPTPVPTPVPPAPTPVPTPAPTPVPTPPAPVLTAAPAAPSPEPASAAPTPSTSVAPAPVTVASSVPTFAPTGAPRTTAPPGTPPPTPSGPGPVLAIVAVAVAGLLGGVAWLLFRRR